MLVLFGQCSSFGSMTGFPFGVFIQEIVIGFKYAALLAGAGW